jgi:hypothetical protein
MAVVGEIVAELFGGIVSILLGVVLGSIVFVIVRAVRRALAHDSRRREVTAPDGEVWTVRVALAPPPLRLALSERAFGMRSEDRRDRRRAGHADDAVTRDSMFHPSGLVERTDEAAGLVAPVLLVVVVLAVALLAVEVVLLVLVALVAFLVRAARRSWQCEVVDPLGSHFHVTSRSLGEARTARDHLAEQIAAGIDPRLRWGSAPSGRPA